MSGALIAVFKSQRGFATVPVAPVSVYAYVTGATTAGVTFIAQGDGGSTITSYVATSTPGSITGTLSQAGSGTISVSGLTTGTAYTFTIHAVNAIGNSAESVASNSITYVGILYSCGYNNVGQLGVGDVTLRSSPTAVGATTNWLTGSAGSFHRSGIRTDGTIWCWGGNTDGELGTNNTTNYSSPVQVGALTTWASVNTGYKVTHAVKTDGTLWAWGNNVKGQLGDGTTIDRSSPVQIGALTTWTETSSDGNVTASVATDGTLWTWGDCSGGLCGLGNGTRYSSPKQVGALTTWATVSVGWAHTLATQTDGTLWAYGKNTAGQLGLGNTTSPYSSPVQVGALTTWLAAAAGRYFSMAIKTDGTIWSWGSNNTGQLGINNTTYKSSPVQVGALTTWLSTSLSTGHGNTGATVGTNVADARLYCWGNNFQGSLGDGTGFNRSSPVQIGSKTDWIGTVTQYAYGTAAISNS